MISNRAVDGRGRRLGISQKQRLLVDVDGAFSPLAAKRSALSSVSFSPLISIYIFTSRALWRQVFQSLIDEEEEDNEEEEETLAFSAATSTTKI